MNNSVEWLGSKLGSAGASQRRAAIAGLALVVLVSGCGSADDKTQGSPPGLSVSALHFDAVYSGDPPAPQSVRVSGPGNYFEVRTPEPVPWLSVTADSVDPVFVFSVTSTELSPARYETPVQFVAYQQDVYRNTKDFIGSVEIPATYSLRNEIQTYVTHFTFRTVQGAPAPEPQKTRVIGTSNAWTLSADQPWVTVSPDQGSGPDELSFGIDPGALPVGAGASTAEVTLFDLTAHATARVTVDAIVDAPSFVLSKEAVALSSIPAGGTVLDTVEIRDNGGGGLPWQATTDADWLRLEPEGELTPSTLTISADATGLAPGVHEATVTISPDPAGSSPAGISLDAIPAVSLPVALTVRDSAPARVALTLPVDNYATNGVIVADPARPYVYVTHEGDSVDGYDSDTGEATASFTRPAGKLGRAAIMPDGSQLFVLNPAASEVVRLDLPGLTPSASWTTSAGSLVAFRCSTRRLLLLGSDSLAFLDADTGESLLTVAPGRLWNGSFAPEVAVSSAGDRLYLLDRGVSPARAHVLDIWCSAFTDPPVAVSPRADATVDLGGSEDLDVAPDGSRVCANVFCLDGKTMETAVSLAVNGYPIASMTFGRSGELYAVDSQGNVLVVHADATYEVTTRFDHPVQQLTVSGDERRLMGRTRYFSVEIIDAAP